MAAASASGRSWSGCAISAGRLLSYILSTRFIDPSIISGRWIKYGFNGMSKPLSESGMASTSTHERSGVFRECGIGETNGTEKMRMIGDMRARCTIMRVEKIIRDHERDNAAFAYCVKRLRNKIIMNRKF